MKRYIRELLYPIFCLFAFIVLCLVSVANQRFVKNETAKELEQHQLLKEVGMNEPLSKEYGLQEFEIYSDLDYLKRCGTAYANISLETMPTEKRESIGMIKPTGWQTIHDDEIDGNYLYNRCHLIGYQLAGENANEKNLITCTREANLAMLPYENEVANYVRRTGNHVLYRVTPNFEDWDYVAKSITIEALSVEDDEIDFTIIIPNVQEGYEIDYSTGNAKKSED